MGTKHVFASCCALVVAACGAGDNNLDPADLELRDVLGIAPETASTWDDAQRLAARHVIDGGLRAADAQPLRTTLLQARTSRAPADTAAAVGVTPLDQRIVTTIATLDRARASRGDEPLGLVTLGFAGDQLVATPHVVSPSTSLDGDLAQALAHDAGHADGPLDVVPVAHLAAIAAYLPATAHHDAELIINAVALASFDRDGHAASTTKAPGAAATSAPALPMFARGPGPTTSTTSTATVAAPARSRRGTVTRAVGNPYSFFGSIAECAASERDRCQLCIANGSCAAITSGSDGVTECMAFDQNAGRGHYSICVDLALAINSVADCAARTAPQCPRDTTAANSLSSLQANDIFLDDQACGSALDSCLASIYGSSNGDFPGPGSDTGSSSHPRNPSVDCSDSCYNDPNCNSDCELEGPDCEDSAEPGSSCSDSNDQSTCSGGDTDVGDNGSCGDSEDSCGADNGNSCDNGDCGGGGDSGCSGGDSGGCDGGGGGDCGGGGGDCGGGGGDCGGGDCNAGTRGRGPGNSLIFAVMWALLPVPFAVRIARRARRRRRAAEAEAAEIAGEELS